MKLTTLMCFRQIKCMYGNDVKHSMKHTKQYETHKTDVLGGMCFRQIKCIYGDDVKHSQLRKGDHHGCRIDETIQLEVSGDTPEGMSGSVPCLWTFACKSSQALMTHQKVCQAFYLSCGHLHANQVKLW